MAQILIEAPPQAEQRVPMTYDAFLALPNDVHAEWVEGEAIIFMTAKRIHQDVAGLLYNVLSTYVQLLRLGWVGDEPFEMRLWPGRSSRLPDVLFVATPHARYRTLEIPQGKPVFDVWSVVPKAKGQS